MNEVLKIALKILSTEDQERRANAAVKLRQMSFEELDYGALKKLFHVLKRYAKDPNPAVSKHITAALKEVEKLARAAKKSHKQSGSSDDTAEEMSSNETDGMETQSEESCDSGENTSDVDQSKIANNDIDALLKNLFEQEGSDLHLKIGKVPVMRVQGELVAVSRSKLSLAQMNQMLAKILRDEERERFDKHGDLDTSYSIPGISRFRLNVLKDTNGIGAVFRTIPFKIPDFDILGIPSVVKEMVAKKYGLVLVTGPTGSGKSTTLASLIHFVNNTRSVHIVTVEDPVEFVHNDILSHISQREVGNDSPSFAHAVVDALREDADIILVGEMRDSETISQALYAAETGCLVLGTLHTTSAVQTMERIINAFPAEQQSQIRNQITGTLVGVVSQTLLPRKEGGRIAAYEILLGSGPIRNLIRENKATQLLSTIETSRGMGMQSLDQHLTELVLAEEVEFEAALAKCADPRSFSELEKQLKDREKK